VDRTDGARPASAYDVTVRAVVLDADGQPQLGDVDAPDDSVPVLACGLCGSDVEKLGSPCSGGVVLGHEVAVREGERRLALIHHRPCGECARCRAGHESTCEEFPRATIFPGGFAERVRAADGVEIPDSVDDVHATMIEPLACVLRGAARVPHGRVLVVGNGFVGRLFRAVLERRGDDVSSSMRIQPAPGGHRTGRSTRSSSAPAAGESRPSRRSMREASCSPLQMPETSRRMRSTGAS
jgi:L-iditol 2-dehydrogenase